MNWSRYSLAALPLIACAQPSQPPDQACRQEVDRIAPQCEGSAALRPCWRKRLSPACFKEATASAGPKSESCKKELQNAAAPCQEFSKRCVEEKVSAGCRETAARLLEARKACDEAVQRVWQLCNAEPQDKQAQCFEQHRPQTSALCR